MSEIQLSEQSAGSKDQLYLRKIRRLAQNIDIALHKLAVSSSLRTVCSPDISNLERLKWGRQLVCVVSIITGQW